MWYWCTNNVYNVLSLRDLQKIVTDNNVKMTETTLEVILEVFGGTHIKPIGKKTLILTTNDVSIKTEFIIVDKIVRPILSLPSLIELKLLKFKNNSVNQINVDD